MTAGGEPLGSKAMNQRVIMTVHAHPDDESSKGAGTIAKYRDLGVSSVLVCCTGGEEGEIHNDKVVLEPGESLGERRSKGLDAATAIIGYEVVERLGHRDSGMPDMEANKRPDAFWNIPLEQSVGELVALVRRYRPTVLISYPDAQHEYPHPDHLRAHDITLAAFDAAADPSAYPELGEPHQVAKLYYTVWPVMQSRLLHEKHLELGLKSPYEERLAWINRDVPFTTSIDIRGYQAVRDNALKAHATQIDPESPWWFGLTEEIRHNIHPYDHYRLAKSRVGAIDVEETDLFEGIE